MKKRRTIYLILAIVIIAAVGVFGILKVSKKTGQTTEKKNEGTFDMYYVPVVNYWSTRSGIKTEELKNEKTIIIEKGEAGNLAAFLGKDTAGRIAEKSTTEIQTGLSENEIAIVRWNSVTPNLKTLSLDGKYLWKKSDFSGYVLKVAVSGSEAEKNSGAFDPDKLTKINFLGDVMLSRHVNTQMNKFGYDYPWKKVAAGVSDADITFANLEVPISDLVSPPAAGMSFVASKKNLQQIKNAGIDIVSVANNHSANFGRVIFDDNLANLAAANISYCGGGQNQAEASKATVIEKNGTKFGFICSSSIVGSMYATAGTSGVYGIEMEPWYRDNQKDFQLLSENIKKAKESADVVVFSPHWGVEYKPAPSDSQQTVAKLATAAGTDLIVGTHPHVVQGSEVAGGKYITYSLGNFIFDQEWSQETKEGAVLEAYFYGNKNVSSNLAPLVIENFSQPHFLDAVAGRSIINRIKSVSAGF